jgi:hypothetical protein
MKLPIKNKKGLGIIIIIIIIIIIMKKEKLRLRYVNFILTLILLTWRIWWAPNNASKWQMGFNSAFKGLI